MKIRRFANASRLNPRVQAGQIQHCIETLEQRQLLSATFGPITSLLGYPVNPYAIVDLNGDAKPDIIGVGEQGQGIEIYVNQGNGTFGQPIQVPNSAGVANPSGLAIGDFNGDGVPDIAVMSGNSTVSCFLGAGVNVNGANPSYLAPVVSSYAVTAGAASPQSVIRPADIGTTQINALVTTSQLQTAHFGGTMDDLVVDDGATGNLVQVLLSTGGGHFQTDTANILTAPGGDEVHLLNLFKIADLNGDGISDIAYVGLVGNDYGVNVQFGAIGGTFLTSQNQYPVPNGGPIGILAATLTSPNGLPDLICNDENFDDVDVLLNNGGGSFAAATVYPVSNSADISIGDFDGNGALDISAGSQILFNTGAGTFSSAQDDSLYALSGRISADLNGDGHADFVEDGAIVQLEGTSSSGGSGSSGVGGSGGGGVGTPTNGLTGAVTGSAPATALIGQKIQITQNLTLTNTTSAAINASAALYLSADGKIDAHSILLTPKITKVKLAAHGHAKITLATSSIPASTPNNTYTLIAKVTDSAGTSLVTGKTVIVARPKIDLSGTFSKQPVVAKNGKTTLALTITNTGNITASGSLKFNLDRSPSGTLAGAKVLSSPTEKIDIKPDKSMKFSVPATLPRGTYFLLIQLDPKHVFHDTNLANNIFATLTKITVA